ncbi:heptaprenyl diphosphate synthase component 1 [Pseudoneobacillus sp. C159]
MILLQQIQSIIMDMKDTIYQRISLPYLQQYIHTPTLDEDKLLFTISVLSNHGLTKEQMEECVVTSMLVQIALDTHERVTNSSIGEEKENSLKQRQLTVLGGTYFSSLYYKILSETSNITMVRVLAEGIKEINEHKIIFYNKDSLEIDKLMNSVMTLESGLINKLADYLQESIWKEIASHFLFIKRLLHEKERFDKSEDSSVLIDGLRKIVFPKTNQVADLSTEQKKYLLAICDQYIEHSIHIFEKGINKIPLINDYVKTRWFHLIKQYAPIAKTFVEEG